MPAPNISALAAKRRLRGLAWKLDRLNRELADLLQSLPVPSQEELSEIVTRTVPLTVEAWLAGALHEALLHLEEAEEILEVARTKTSRGLKRDWQSGSFPLDLMRSLRKVVEHRQRPDGGCARMSDLVRAGR
jgi:hypothetical protein